MDPRLRRRAPSLLGALLALACSHRPWPDEPGIPIELRRADNVEAGETFLSTVANRRRADNRTEPIVAPLYQEAIRPFAEDLQTGKTSVGAVERDVEAWARRAYRRDVKTFVLDCSAGSAMPLPPLMVETPSLVIAYAAAHFRPRSLPNAQCAIVAVVVVGSERVEAPNL